MQNKQFPPDKKFYRDQIITTDDLLNFKYELIEEIKGIFKEMQENGGKKWLRSSDVRKLLGISPGTLQNLRINGHLPYNKVGGVIFYDRQDLLKMIESNRIDNGF
jgi:hypothetical protein